MNGMGHLPDGFGVDFSPMADLLTNGARLRHRNTRMRAEWVLRILTPPRLGRMTQHRTPHAHPYGLSNHVVVKRSV